VFQLDTFNHEADSELVLLQQEITIRDQLVQQLSEELFRLIKGNTFYLPEANSDALPPEVDLQSYSEFEPPHPRSEDYTSEIANRDQEIFQLRQLVQELKERCQVLESVIKEFPEIYRRKFTERMKQVQEKVTVLQQENRRLQSDLKNVSYRLAVQIHSADDVDLPSFPQLSSASRHKN
jgi:hypothetical protein